MSGYEQQLVMRAEMLDDTGDLVRVITVMLASAQGAGADPPAVTSLAAAARALDPAAGTTYDAGGKEDRRRGSGYRSDGEFLEAVREAENDVYERLGKVQRLKEAAATALNSAQAGLQAAYALPVKDPCDGCHGIRETAIAEALRRATLCDAAAVIPDPLIGRLQTALNRLRQVPQDLGEAYELVYEFVRKATSII